MGKIKCDKHWENYTLTSDGFIQVENEKGQKNFLCFNMINAFIALARKNGGVINPKKDRLFPHLDLSICKQCPHRKTCPELNN